MTPEAILREAVGHGLRLTRTATGTIKVAGDHEAVDRWLPIIREHKLEILEALASQEEADALDLREHFEERAGILEFDAGMPRPEAELEAARITATLARNRGYAWASLRAALADYSALLSQLPDKPGPVDALPFGVAKLVVLRGGRAVRQGAFTGTYEVKA